MSSLSEELLPGIPHHITLTHIATKLPWTACHALSQVSQNLRRSIQSREVYRARIFTHTAEELLVFTKEHQLECRDDLHLHCTYRNSISLYSMREKAFYHLPPIPHRRGSSRFCHCVASDGNLYVYTHNRHLKSTGNTGTEEIQVYEEQMQVYVFDLAATRHWKECTTIQGPVREDAPRFVCLFNSEEEHKFVADGSSDSFGCKWQVCYFLDGRPEMLYFQESPELMRFTRDPRGVMVEANEYQIRLRQDQQAKIYVNDTHNNIWRHQHSISCDDIIREMAHELRVRGGLLELGVSPNNPLKVGFMMREVVGPVNNELFAIAYFWSIRRNAHPGRYVLLQSKGFGTESEEIVWQRIPEHVNVDGPTIRCRCSILL